MVPVVNSWAPAFTRLAGLGQISPIVPPTPVAPAVQGGARIAAGIGMTVLTLGFVGLSTAFMYGVSRDSKSSLVKIPGYILAGTGAVLGVVEAVGLGALIIAGGR